MTIRCCATWLAGRELPGGQGFVLLLLVTILDWDIVKASYHLNCWECLFYFVYLSWTLTIARRYHAWFTDVLNIIFAFAGELSYEEREKMRLSMRANIHDLHRAVQLGRSDWVQEILNQDNVNINGTVCGTTALSLALYKERNPIFELFLCHKCSSSRLDLNKLSKDDKQRIEPPLITACRLGNKRAVKLLLKFGAYVDSTDNFQHTALWMATLQRYTDLVKLLLCHGASVNPSHLWTHSPLFFAVKYSSRRTGIAKLLIYQGADVTIKSTLSLLYCAIIQGDQSMARLIVEAGYNVSKDERIRSEWESGALTRSEDLSNWLGVELTTPVPLQRQCRSTIRTTIAKAHRGRYFMDNLKELPLPKSILNYLALSELAWEEGSTCPSPVGSS